VCDGYGYPRITREDKKAILGGNMSRLMGVEMERKIKILATIVR
jgi:hypothetical protein